MSIRILLADDHRITREGLRALLENEKNIEVVGEAENGIQVIRLTGELAPDIVIMDVSMPEMNGVECTNKILKEHPDCRVIALSMHSGKPFVAKMMEAGASAYLLKDCAGDELMEAIRVVHDGGTHLGQGIAPVIVQDYVQSLRHKEDFFSSLTQREREVVQLISEGQGTKEVAAKLNISPKTVETHRRNAMEKLKIDNIAELTKYAIREGLTDLNG